MVKAINHATMITGNPVAMANTGGSSRLLLSMVRGIRSAKYSTPLYGQNANAKTTPSRNMPR